MPMSEGRRFNVLDGLRGAAALSVMLFHLWPTIPFGLIGHGYLAVDFFFLLSGFVIAWSYDNRLSHGLTALRFSVIRSIRLYPLVIMSVLGVAILRSSYPFLTFPSIAFSFHVVMNMLLLPSSLSFNIEKFPFNPPSWSLFYEFGVNVMYAVTFPYLTKRRLIIIVVFTSVALATLVIKNGSVEYIHQSLFSGSVRTAFSFSLGVLLARLYTGASARLPSWTLYAALLFVVGVPKEIRYNSWFELSCIVLVFPAIVWLGASCINQNKYNIDHALGEISYPVYVIHMPTVAWLGVILGHFLSSSLITIIAVTIIPFLAAVVVRYYDRPVRAWLSHVLLSRPPSSDM